MAGVVRRWNIRPRYGHLRRRCLCAYGTGAGQHPVGHLRALQLQFSIHPLSATPKGTHPSKDAAFRVAAALRNLPLKTLESIERFAFYRYLHQVPMVSSKRSFRFFFEMAWRDHPSVSGRITAHRIFWHPQVSERATKPPCIKCTGGGRYHVPAKCGSCDACTGYQAHLGNSLRGGGQTYRETFVLSVFQKKASFLICLERCAYGERDLFNLMYMSNANVVFP